MTRFAITVIDRRSKMPNISKNCLSSPGKQVLECHKETHIYLFLDHPLQSYHHADDQGGRACENGEKCQQTTIQIPWIPHGGSATP